VCGCVQHWVWLIFVVFCRSIKELLAKTTPNETEVISLNHPLPFCADMSKKKKKKKSQGALIDVIKSLIGFLKGNNPR
jgi:hypothetical protein